MLCCARRQAPMTEEVKLIRGNDRINQLAKRRDIAEGVARIRVEMAGADRTYAMRSRRAPARRRTHSVGCQSWPRSPRGRSRWRASWLPWCAGTAARSCQCAAWVPGGSSALRMRRTVKAKPPPQGDSEGQILHLPHSTASRTRPTSATPPPANHRGHQAGHRGMHARLSDAPRAGTRRRARPSVAVRGNRRCTPTVPAAGRGPLTCIVR